VPDAVLALNPVDPASPRTQAGEAEAVTRSGADGRFAFDQVPPGSYAVTAVTDHWAAAMVTNLNVKQGGQSIAELKLVEPGEPIVRRRRGRTMRRT